MITSVLTHISASVMLTILINVSCLWL